MTIEQIAAMLARAAEATNKNIIPQKIRVGFADFAYISDYAYDAVMTLAKAEGWTANPKWKNMPEQMLGYRAASFFARMYCPEALMGLQTYEEVEDIEPKKNGAADLTNALKEDN